MDDSYLEANESLDDLFDVIKEKKCKFIVAGRGNVVSSKFENLNLQDLLEKYRNSFEIIGEKDFREDVSSTQKRRQDNWHQITE